MLLIPGYDAAMRVGELVSLKVENLHLDAETPYIRILGKGGKYRSVPLMKKTVSHLFGYLGGKFHKAPPEPAMPLFMLLLLWICWPKQSREQNRTMQRWKRTGKTEK